MEIIIYWSRAKEWKTLGTAALDGWESHKCGKSLMQTDLRIKKQISKSEIVGLRSDNGDAKAA